MSRYWTWELLDLDGVALAELVPRRAEVVRELGGNGAEAALVLDPDSVGAQAIGAASTAHIIRGWRGALGATRTLRYAGLVSMTDGEVSAEGADALMVTAHDPFAALAERVVQEAVTYSATTPRDIVAGLLAAQDARAATHLRVAAGTGGPTRDRSYERGSRVQELVVRLSEVQDGFWYVVNPVDDAGTPAVVGELVLRHPDPGSTVEAAPWEYGEGSIGNLAAAQVQTRPPVNHVLALGAGEGEEQIFATATDAASVAAYGLRDAVISHTDVSVQATLDAHAADALAPEPRKTVTAVAAPDDPAGPHVARLWDDFDVGDTVPVRVRKEAPSMSFDGYALVTRVRLAMDATGRERIAALEFADNG